MATTFSLIGEGDEFGAVECSSCSSDEECRTCGPLSGAEIMMIQGLTSFGDVGAMERMAFGSMIVAGENVELGPPRSSLGSRAASWGLDIEDESGEDDEDALEVEEGIDEDVISEDEAEAEEAEALDKSAIDTEERREALSKILQKRRSAVAQAIKERAKEESTVERLDKKIVDELRPQYEAALRVNEDLARRLAATMQILNAQRLAAYQKAINWTKFQGVAGQMARNTRAQAALVVAYAAAKKIGDTAQMANISKAFVNLGKVSQEFKGTRSKQKLAWSIQAQNRRMANLSMVLKKLNAGLKKVMRGRPVESLTGKDKAAYDLLKRSIDRQVANYRKGDAAFKKAYLAAQAKLKLPPAEITPEEEQIVEEIQDVQPGMGALVPYCAVYTRDRRGPYCAVRTTMRMDGLGDLGGFWSKFKRGLLGVVTGGASELVLNKKIRGGIKTAAIKVGKGIKWIAKKVVCPIANAVNKGINQKKDEAKKDDKAKVDGLSWLEGGADVAKQNPYVAAASVASAAIASACKPGTKPSDTDEAKKAKAEGIVEIREGKPFYRAWWFLPAALLVGGVGAAFYFAEAPPPMRTQMRGLGRGAVRRSRRSHRKALGCGCGG